MVLRLALAVSCKHINQANRCILHVNYLRLDLRENVVEEHLKNNSSDKTHDSSQKRNLDTTSYNSWRHCCRTLDIVECLDHTNNGTHETE